MFRSIREKLLPRSAQNPRRKARRSPPPRRLSFERLEGRELLSVTLTPNAISDGSFEVPALAAKTFQYMPTGSPWQFSAGTGVTSNGSGFTSSNPNAPDGSQVAFVQGTGSMSQTLYLDAGTYNLSFMAAQRAGFFSGT